MLQHKTILAELNEEKVKLSSYHSTIQWMMVHNSTPSSSIAGLWTPVAPKEGIEVTFKACPMVACDTEDDITMLSVEVDFDMRRADLKAVHLHLRMTNKGVAHKTNGPGLKVL
jgi:hypothetical protein